MTLKEWKALMQIGVTVRCIWRNYWETRPAEKPACGYQDMTVVETQTNGLWFSRPGDTRRSWMTMPKASEILHTHTGFELYHAGIHVATYVYLYSEAAHKAIAESEAAERTRIGNTPTDESEETPGAMTDEEKTETAEHIVKSPFETMEWGDGQAKPLETIDITPVDMTTPEGIQLVRNAQQEWDSATHLLANTLKELYGRLRS